MKLHFTSIVNVLVERRRFTLRRQPPDEPVRVYVSARRLFKTCDYGAFLETALWDKVVHEIRRLELWKKLVLKGSQRWPRLLKFCKHSSKQRKVLQSARRGLKPSTSSWSRKSGVVQRVVIDRQFRHASVTGAVPLGI